MEKAAIWASHLHVTLLKLCASACQKSLQMHHFSFELSLQKRTDQRKDIQDENGVTTAVAAHTNVIINTGRVERIHLHKNNTWAIKAMGRKLERN